MYVFEINSTLQQTPQQSVVTELIFTNNSVYMFESVVEKLSSIKVLFNYNVYKQNFFIKTLN